MKKPEFKRVEGPLVDGMKVRLIAERIIGGRVTESEHIWKSEKLGRDLPLGVGIVRRWRGVGEDLASLGENDEEHGTRVIEPIRRTALFYNVGSYHYYWEELVENVEYELDQVLDSEEDLL